MFILGYGIDFMHTLWSLLLLFWLYKAFEWIYILDRNDQTISSYLSKLTSRWKSCDLAYLLINVLEKRSLDLQRVYSFAILPESFSEMLQPIS